MSPYWIRRAQYTHPSNPDTLEERKTKGTKQIRKQKSTNKQRIRVLVHITLYVHTVKTEGRSVGTGVGTIVFQRHCRFFQKGQVKEGCQHRTSVFGKSLIESDPNM